MAETVTPAARELLGELIDLLQDIGRRFETPKITLIIRSPSLTADIVICNDDPAEVAKVVAGMSPLEKPN